MHGRPRQKAGAPDQDRVKAAAQKATLFGQLSGEVLSRRAARRYDAESLALAARLLQLHPEVYTCWNYRREALQPVLAGGGEAAVAAVAGELALTEKALQRNPKSYATWHHRRWVVAHGMCSLEQELRLVGLLLEADERNFHGWGYRRFVVQLMGTPAARELDYAEQKINSNFSNYSAWHCRSALLPALHGGGGDGTSGAVMSGASGDAASQAEAALSAAMQAAALGGEGEVAAAASSSSQGAAAADAPAAAPVPLSLRPLAATGGSGVTATAVVPLEALDEEYELVKQAFYTEPEDQSGWFYHRWLLGCSLARWQAARGSTSEGTEHTALLGVLRREQQMCEELLEIEPDAKWPLLTLVRLQELQQAALAGGGGAAAGGDDGGGSGLAGEVRQGYERLIALDPLRAGYYRDAAEGRAHVVAAPSVPGPALA